MSCEDVLRTPLEGVLKMPRKMPRLEDASEDAKSWWCLGRWKTVTLKTSSRRLQDVLENKECLLGCQFFLQLITSYNFIQVTVYCFGILKEFITTCTSKAYQLLEWDITPVFLSNLNKPTSTFFLLLIKHYKLQGKAMIWGSKSELISIILPDQIFVA